MVRKPQNLLLLPLSQHHHQSKLLKVYQRTPSPYKKFFLFYKTICSSSKAAGDYPKSKVFKTFKPDTYFTVRLQEGSSNTKENNHTPRLYQAIAVAIPRTTVLISTPGQNHNKSENLHKQ